MSIFFICLSRPALATSTLSDFTYLQGVDTVVVSEATLPEHLLLPQQKAVQDSSEIYLTVKIIFADLPWVKVLRESDVTYAQRAKPNVLTLYYGVSAQNDSGTKDVIKVGSMAMAQIKMDKIAIARLTLTPVSFPFVIPDKRDEFDRKIAEGVHYLTDYLPSYFACANKRGECRPQHPFQEKIIAPCPQPVIGQQFPLPCNVK